MEQLMRILKKLMATVSALMVVTATRAFALVQEAKIQVTTHESHGAWYTQPVWIAIGVIALILIVVLITMAGRGRSNTTVVK
jgi:cell division protein FtsW (lipid II flippase)